MHAICFVIHEATKRRFILRLDVQRVTHSGRDIGDRRLFIVSIMLLAKSFWRIGAAKASAVRARSPWISNKPRIWWRKFEGTDYFETGYRRQEKSGQVCIKYPCSSFHSFDGNPLWFVNDIVSVNSTDYTSIGEKVGPLVILLRESQVLRGYLTKLSEEMEQVIH